MIYTETIILKATVVYDTGKAAEGEYEEATMRGVINNVLPLQGVEKVKVETVLRAVAKTPDAMDQVPDRPMGTEEE